MSLISERPAATYQQALRRLIGRPEDWHLRRPHFRPWRPGLAWVGPTVIVASAAISWLAFDDAVGDEGGSPAFGLWIGAVAILLMAWSFVLAVRIRAIEPLFGGLDNMYRSHRWAGSLAVAAMFLHTRAEPDVEGIRGASRDMADIAEELAGVAEIMLYLLVVVSLLRWIPYRYWRWTHKLLGLPFVFACFHFFTAEKPYANGSAWGWWFGAFMVAGLAAYLVRVIGRDVLVPGLRYRVGAARVSGKTLELVLEPEGRHLEYEAGQFAVVKIQLRGLTEPHVFTIASPPDAGNLRFFIRDLGDWTRRLHLTDLAGARVVVEGPYGRFEPIDGAGQTVWVAGGVGITPFLAAASSLAPSGAAPVLFYCVRERDDAMGLDVLERASEEGRIDLVFVESGSGERFGLETLEARFDPGGLVGAHIALCGPAALVDVAEQAARSLGATSIEREDFDIRQGFGPDLSREIDTLITREREK